MSSLRNAYLEVLGIDRWVPRGTVEEAATLAAPPLAPKVSARVEMPATAPATAPPRVAPAPYQRGPLAADWPGLRDQVAGCPACEQLCRTRTQTVFGVGNERAQWLIIGEAPGAEEDRQGEPFVGRAGKLLDSMLQAIGLARGQVFIANVLKCRPPNNRVPAPAEAAQCLPYLERQIALLRPSIMLALGSVAAQNLLATDAPVGRLRGHVHAFGSARTPLIVTYHPAYLLRSPGEKRKAWEDLKFARRIAGGKAD